MNSQAILHRCRALASELEEQKRFDDALAVMTALQVYLDTYPAGDGSSRGVVTKECERLSAEIRKRPTGERA